MLRILQELKNRPLREGTRWTAYGGTFSKCATPRILVGTFFLKGEFYRQNESDSRVKIKFPSF